MTSKPRFARDAMLAYGLLAYASFHASFLYLILFLNDAPVPFTVEGGTPRPLDGRSRSTSVSWRSSGCSTR